MSQAMLMLKALAYESPDRPDLTRSEDVRQIVSWLESRKIRQYKPEQRKEGIGDLKSADWNKHFSQYLEDLECPIPYQADNVGTLLDWLLHHAVSLEYTDAAPKMSLPDDDHQPETEHSRPHPAVTFPDVSSDEVSSGLSLLVEKLRLQSPDTSLIDQLKACRDLLTLQLLPAVGDAHTRQVSAEAGHQLEKLDARSFPLGFTTGDKHLDAAATVLRMLYIKDLRLLQSQVDESIVAIQEFTANPRTDSALGRIGR